MMEITRKEVAKVLRALHDGIMVHIAIGMPPGGDEYLDGYKDGLENFRQFFYGPNSTFLDDYMETLKPSTKVEDTIDDENHLWFGPTITEELVPLKINTTDIPKYTELC